MPKYIILNCLGFFEGHTFKKRHFGAVDKKEKSPKGPKRKRQKRKDQKERKGERGCNMCTTGLV